MTTTAAGPKIVLILGSAPDAIASRQWHRSVLTSIVAINNAWAVREDWDYLIHADDFPAGRLPAKRPRSSCLVMSNEFVPAQNEFGGFVYAGGTMAFTAAYWALHALKPDVLAFFGCDMIYPDVGPTHFYGMGTADPLRRDVTLRSLESKSARLLAAALRTGALCLNLSELPSSRLVFPRSTVAALARLSFHRINALRKMFEALIDVKAYAAAEALEADLGYFVESGRYWEQAIEFDETALDRLDALWTASVARVPGILSAREMCLLRKR